MISANHNYDNGYISLVNIVLPGLPIKLKVNEFELLLKSEFHISLICVKRIAPLIDNQKASEIEAEIETFFKDFIKTIPLTDYNVSDVYRLVQREERVTLVVMVDVPGIKQFFEALEAKYGIELPLQPTHITIYTLQPEAGIGILSIEELEKDSKIVDVAI